jgi:malic enzyme
MAEIDLRQAALDYGGINLEDIKAPECFTIEKKLRERMKIPVFHDDQHGTAIVAAAAILNALEHAGKDIAKVKMVVSGAGAAALACLDLIGSLGLRPENTLVTDLQGVVYTGRAASRPTASTSSSCGRRCRRRATTTSSPSAIALPAPGRRPTTARAASCRRARRLHTSRPRMSRRRSSAALRASR